MNPMQMDNTSTNYHALNSASLKEQVKTHALNEDDRFILGGGSTTKVCPIEILTNSLINLFDNLVDKQLDDSPVDLVDGDLGNGFGSQPSPFGSVGQEVDLVSGKPNELGILLSSSASDVEKFDLVMEGKSITFGIMLESSSRSNCRRLTLLMVSPMHMPS